MVILSDIEGCKAGKRRAHKKVYESTIRLAYSAVQRYVQDKELQQDIIQEAYAKAFSKIELFDPSRGTFEAWLSRIVVNECLMYLRRAKRLPLLMPLDCHTNQSEPLALDLEQLSRVDILQLLKDMPTGYRIVFMMYIIDGYSHKEIAQELNIEPDTSRSQLSRAKRWVRKNLKNHPIIEEYGQFR